MGFIQEESKLRAAITIIAIVAITCFGLRELGKYMHEEKDKACVSGVALMTSRMAYMLTIDANINQRDNTYLQNALGPYAKQSVELCKK